ncbi:MAG: hypothetical protein A2Z83_03860 [Omnitrophica bacterium GWA2_52_8]|nr:MAG: hypothetical protein A2Z83_03860 [Omnitrophica bacterium GWA2_52_8]
MDRQYSAGVLHRNTRFTRAGLWAAVLLFAGGMFSASGVQAGELNLERLSPEEIGTVNGILEKLVPLIEDKRASGDIAKLTFEEVYVPLLPEEKAFLKWFQDFDPLKAGIKTKWQGISEGVPDLVRVEGQTTSLADGRQEILPPQFVPPDVYDAYGRMMQAMQKDIGRRLFIESGYRSPAYQLYLFLFYLGNHEYSIRETARWNAFPGYSEHGNPANQALDFINESGISGETNPADFEALPEYAWLVDHAGEYGFVLSFPEDDPTGIAFEPWHWRYQPDPRA